MPKGQWQQYGYLAHYGIPGMRWHIRRSPQQLAVSRDHAEAQVLRSKKAGELSNEEMRKLTARMQLERSYKDLSKKEVSIGRQVAEKIIVGSLTTVGTAVATAAIRYAINQALRKTKAGPLTDILVKTTSG